MADGENSLTLPRWGPFWVCATLVLLIAVTGNLAKFMQADDVKYDYKFVPLAASLVIRLLFTKTSYTAQPGSAR